MLNIRFVASGNGKNQVEVHYGLYTKKAVENLEKIFDYNHHHFTDPVFVKMSSCGKKRGKYYFVGRSLVDGEAVTTLDIINYGAFTEEMMLKKATEFIESIFKDMQGKWKKYVKEFPAVRDQVALADWFLDGKPLPKRLVGDPMTPFEQCAVTALTSKLVELKKTRQKSDEVRASLDEIWTSYEKRIA